MLVEEKGTSSNPAQMENQGKDVSQASSSSTDSVSSSSGSDYFSLSSLSLTFVSFAFFWGVMIGFVL